MIQRSGENEIYPFKMTPFFEKFRCDLGDLLLGGIAIGVQQKEQRVIREDLQGPLKKLG